MRRPGRFDFRLQILPPAYEEKLQMVDKALGEDDHGLESQRRQDSHRRNLTVATLSEMTRLVQALRRDPTSIDHILGNFDPELVDDPSLEEEIRYNSFDRRT